MEHWLLEEAAVTAISNPIFFIPFLSLLNFVDFVRLKRLSTTGMMKDFKTGISSNKKQVVYVYKVED